MLKIHLNILDPVVGPIHLSSVSGSKRFINLMSRNKKGRCALGRPSPYYQFQINKKNELRNTLNAPSHNTLNDMCNNHVIFNSHSLPLFIIYSSLSTHMHHNRHISSLPYAKIHNLTTKFIQNAK